MKKLDDPIYANKGQYTLNPNTENYVAARLICMGKLSIDKEQINNKNRIKKPQGNAKTVPNTRQFFYTI